MNEEQIKQTIESLEEQGAKQEEIQEWLNGLQSEQSEQTPDMYDVMTNPDAQGMSFGNEENIQELQNRANTLAQDIGIQNLFTGGIGALDLGTGILKGAGSTLYGMGSLFGKAIKKPLSEEQPEYLQAKTPLEKIGKTTEQIGEFFIPFGFGKNLVMQATEYAVKTAMQTGGNIPQTTGTFLLGLAIPPVITKTGKVIKKIGVGLAERMYSTIFKTAEKDLKLAYQSIAKGKELNPTLAREVLDRGLRGNPENMAVYSFNKLKDLENQVQSTAKSIKQPLKVGFKKTYERFLQSVVEQYKGGFYVKRAREANQLLNELNQTGNKEIAVPTALKLRRFIDNIRNTSSFRLNPNLAPKQEEYKYAADLLRKKLGNAGLKDLMNEERIFIEAIDDIVKKAAQSKNKNVIGLVDLLAGGGGMVSGSPTGGIGAAVAIRGFQQPFTLTNLGYAIDRLSKKAPELTKTTPAIMGITQQIKNQIQ